MENNNPINTSNMALLIKLIIWIVIWVLIALIVFIMFIFLGATISEAIRNSANHLAFSPIVWLAFMWIGLIGTLLGNLTMSFVYNVIWPEDYYDIKLISSAILVVNLLLLLPFLFLYFFTGTVLQDINMLFVVFAFQLTFSTYVSVMTMDVVKQPNYSLLYIIWDSTGFILTLLIFFVIFTLSSSDVGQVEKNVLFFPSILAFSIIPFIGTLFEKFYYKLYEVGNDFLYVPSLSEVLVDEEEVDEVNVKL